MRSWLVLTSVLLLAACSGDDRGDGGSPAGDGPFAVGTLEETFVDGTRPTKANGDVPEKDSRTLFTRIYYPALGTPESRAVPGAAPATSEGPFPLIVFAHGFQALGDDVEVAYQVSAYYDPSAEGRVRWDEPRVGARWPLADVALSPKDAAAPDLPPDFEGVDA